MADIPLLLWSAEETGEALGITPDAVKNLHRVEVLRGHKVGRVLRWKPDDVRQFVDGLGGKPNA